MLIEWVDIWDKRDKFMLLKWVFCRSIKLIQWMYFWDEKDKFVLLKCISCRHIMVI